MRSQFEMSRATQALPVFPPLAPEGSADPEADRTHPLPRPAGTRNSAPGAFTRPARPPEASAAEAEGRGGGELTSLDDRFWLMGRLGAGSMGVVYQAWDPRLARTVAVKVLRREARDEARRFVREARVLARLDHPHLVRVHEAGMLGGRAFLAMEMVDGPTLRDAGRRLSPAEKVRVMVGVVRGLAAVHEAGVVHRDVKPGNILLRRDGEDAPWEGVLVDFGIAREISRNRDGRPARAGDTLPGILLGTPSYVAPEQIVGEPAAPAADLYGVGAVLYELLAGRPPHVGGTPSDVLRKVLSTTPRRLAEAAPDLPSSLTSLVDSCLAPCPANRPPCAGLLAEGLEAALAEMVPERAPERLRGRPPTESARTERGRSPARVPAPREERSERRSARSALLGSMVDSVLGRRLGAVLFAIGLAAGLGWGAVTEAEPPAARTPSSAVSAPAVSPILHPGRAPARAPICAPLCRERCPRQGPEAAPFSVLPEER